MWRLAWLMLLAILGAWRTKEDGASSQLLQRSIAAQEVSTADGNTDDAAKMSSCMTYMRLKYRRWNKLFNMSASSTRLGSSSNPYGGRLGTS